VPRYLALPSSFPVQLHKVAACHTVSPVPLVPQCIFCTCVYLPGCESMESGPRECCTSLCASGCSLLWAGSTSSPSCTPGTRARASGASGPLVRGSRATNVQKVVSLNSSHLIRYRLLFIPSRLRYSRRSRALMLHINLILVVLVSNMSLTVVAIKRCVSQDGVGLVKRGGIVL
jgi:hypothetical protein